MNKKNNNFPIPISLCVQNIGTIIRRAWRRFSHLKYALDIAIITTTNISLFRGQVSLVFSNIIKKFVISKSWQIFRFLFKIFFI